MLEDVLYASRNHQGYTQEQLGSLIGVRNITVCSYEKDCSKMQLRTLRNWYKASGEDDKRAIERELKAFLCAEC